MRTTPDDQPDWLAQRGLRCFGGQKRQPTQDHKTEQQDKRIGAIHPLLYQTSEDLLMSRLDAVQVRSRRHLGRVSHHVVGTAVIAATVD